MGGTTSKRKEGTGRIGRGGTSNTGNDGQHQRQQRQPPSEPDGTAPTTHVVAGVDGEDSEGPKLKTQDEVKEKFLPKLRKEGRVYSKPATTLTYARRGTKGEKIATVINGKKETHNQAKDESSWVVRGKSNEIYIVTNDVFQSRYDVSSARPVDQEDREVPTQIKTERFQGYKSKPVPMLALEVDELDMVWIGGKDCMPGKPPFAYFDSPWGEPQRVENGDMLVTQYHEGNDEVYRVEKAAFHVSYEPHDIPQ